MGAPTPKRNAAHFTRFLCEEYGPAPNPQRIEDAVALEGVEEEEEEDEEEEKKEEEEEEMCNEGDAEGQEEKEIGEPNKCEKELNPSAIPNIDVAVAAAAAASIRLDLLL